MKRGLEYQLTRIWEQRAIYGRMLLVIVILFFIIVGGIHSFNTPDLEQKREIEQQECRYLGVC